MLPDTEMPFDCMVLASNFSSKKLFEISCNPEKVDSPGPISGFRLSTRVDYGGGVS